MNFTPKQLAAYRRFLTRDPRYKISDHKARESCGLNQADYAFCIKYRTALSQALVNPDPRRYRPLGVQQAEVLWQLQKEEAYYPRCGWVWSTHSETVRLLESLVRRELVIKETLVNSAGVKTTRYYPKNGGA